MCHLDIGKKTRRLDGGMRKCRKVYSGRDRQKRSGIVREMKKVDASTNR